MNHFPLHGCMHITQHKNDKNKKGARELVMLGLMPKTNMSVLGHKIDFALVFTVRNANPNGDPLDGGRPRTTYDGRGEVSDVCLKRKIRNRLLDEGYSVFVQSDDHRVDKCRSLKDRVVDAADEFKKEVEGKEEVTDDDYAAFACKKWIDVRAFGQVFAFKEKKGDKKEDSVSIGIRGPVTIQSAFSIAPVNIVSLQITKSVNLETGNDPDKKGADTMGTKHRVEFGVYTTFGSINVQTAEKTGFSEEDAEVIKDILRTLFRNDASSARPDGSMEVVRLVWWTHNCPNGQYSSARVHRSLRVTESENGIPIVTVDDSAIPGLYYEILDGE